MDKDTFTDADKNVLREYIATESGKKLLMKMVNYELNLFAEGYNNKTTNARQIQIINKASGVYWVRSIIEELTKVPTPKK